MQLRIILLWKNLNCENRLWQASLESLLLTTEDTFKLRPMPMILAWVMLWICFCPSLHLMDADLVLLIELVDSLLTCMADCEPLLESRYHQQTCHAHMSKSYAFVGVVPVLPTWLLPPAPDSLFILLLLPATKSCLKYNTFCRKTCSIQGVENLPSSLWVDWSNS